LVINYGFLNTKSREHLEDTLDPKLKDESGENTDLNTESFAYTEASRTKRSNDQKIRALLSDLTVKMRILPHFRGKAREHRFDL